TLALLSSKSAAQTAALSLVATSGFAASRPAAPEWAAPESAPAGVEVTAREPVIATTPAPPSPEQASSIAAGQAAESAAARKPAAAPANVHATVTAPSKPPRTKVYLLACALLAALAGGIFGKSLWWPSTN